MGMRVAVVGAGIMGLSTAWALARRGHQVSVYDQYAVPNPLGSSVDQHRLIRHAYGAEAGYTAMVDQAYQAWDRLWADLGETLYVPTGTLCVGSIEDTGWLHDSAATLAERGRAVRWLSGPDLAAEFPLIASDGVREAFHLDSGGVLLAGRIIELMAHHLPGRGVTIHPHMAVEDVDPERGTLRLADRSTVEADAVVIAAGPWVRRLAPSVAARVTPSRQVLTYLTIPDALRDAWARHPMVLDIDPDCGFYLVPPVAGTGMKIGDHRFTLTGDPDQDRDAELEEAERIWAFGRARLAEPERYSIASAATCFYTCEKDERFVVEPVGKRAWVMTGFSGHGFKFGAVLGEAMAAALENPGLGPTLTSWAAGASPDGEADLLDKTLFDRSSLESP
ncbi:FAD-dependent oxidoreductase [Skermanella stibiiresistens SB22]|uniref:FAD-dependent oxidoreductase n=1 Tax=Skermanella stibiiresistens SB22 TaxID=1385369 RepID=W9GYA9_9PROT|nr:FAD-dependent oxidoreductase [Skermanella stibiiresistens]EWY37591.1 FAD-dependent oxidoreductase [Skermanella stibiiresistens SB22]